MSSSSSYTKPAQDNFKIYFTEKLWEMIPAFYRDEDGLAENPGVLRSIVEIVAEQGAILLRSQHRLSEDQFIAWCSDWAVPYIGALLGTRLDFIKNPRARKAEVANTIAQKRRSGTLGLLEQLISRITSWEGTVQESFRRLARTRHMLDPVYNLDFSRTITPPGGLANLRSTRISELAGKPFDQYHYAADLRRPKGNKGLYGINRLIFHLYRLKAFPVYGATPYPFPGHPQYNGKDFSFHPSGRVAPLFMPRNRPEDIESWRSAREWQLPGPIRCRLLGHSEYLITESVIRHLAETHGLTEPAQLELQTLKGQLFQSESTLKKTLNTLSSRTELLSQLIYNPLLNKSIIEDCGKAQLMPNVVSLMLDSMGTINDRAETLSGNLIEGLPSTSVDKQFIIDPENGLFSISGDPLTETPCVNYHYGFSEFVGAGGYPRPQVEGKAPDELISGGQEIDSDQLLNDGLLQIEDSRTYGPISGKRKIVNLALQAKNMERPYLRLGSDWRLNSGPYKDSQIYLNGIWLGASDAGQSVIISGDFECITIEHCTFDPGGAQDFLGDEIHALSLLIEAAVDELIIKSSIMGPIHIVGNGLVESLTIHDSIIQSVDPGTKAIIQNIGNSHLERVTVFGETELHRLNATSCILTERCDVTDTQRGCFRFSVAAEGSRVPRSYPHPLMSFTESNHWFTSRSFGHPGYAQLSETAPSELTRGGENESEIGAFSKLNNATNLDGLKAKIEEYLPVGQAPIFNFET